MLLTLVLYAILLKDKQRYMERGDTGTRTKVDFVHHLRTYKNFTKT